MSVELTQPPSTLTKSAIERGWIEQLARIVNCLVLSGTTAQRPTKFLYPGRVYFDTSLGANGKPIFVKKAGTGWITADGVDA